MRRIWTVRQLGLLALVLATFGCSSSGGGSSSSTPTGPTATGGGGVDQGTVTVMLTDSPFSDATAVLVTFSEVQVHRSGGDWVTLPFSPPSSSRTCDLKKLTGATDVLGVGALAAGHYTMIRLVISSVTIYTGGAPTGAPACNASASLLVPTGSPTATPVDVPSGEVKLNREFDVPPAGATTITLDFDGDKSIRQQGNGTFFVQPVIGVVSVS